MNFRPYSYIYISRQCVGKASLITVEKHNSLFCWNRFMLYEGNRSGFPSDSLGFMELPDEQTVILVVVNSADANDQLREQTNRGLFDNRGLSVRVVLQSFLMSR